MNEEEAYRPIRLDQYVSNELKEQSRSFGGKLITKGMILVNGKPQTKLSYKVKQTDTVFINYDPVNADLKDEIDLPVLYEDDDCVVIAKPTGILSHSKGSFNPEGTVASWLSPRVKDIPGDRAGIVHRLDRGTSGVMICAKTNNAQKWLQKQFSSRKVKKTYIAVIYGHLKADEAVIDMPIERNPKKPQTFRVGINGKPALTGYKVLSKNEKYSLVELTPTTGRTHQLRVHLSNLGHPIVGDLFYEGKPADRLYLHAKSLELTLPSKERKLFESKLPVAFNNIVK
jgi:23S rRNA pseudouridine1911/1915/1917 synthase